MGVCSPACCGGTEERRSVTAQPSLPTADKAVRHGRQLIPLLLNYWRRRDAGGVYDEASNRREKHRGRMERRYWSWKMRVLKSGPCKSISVSENAFHFLKIHQRPCGTVEASFLNAGLVVCH